MTRYLLAAVVVVLGLAAARPAHALDHGCKGGKTWSPSARSCVAPVVVPAKFKYKEALTAIESKVKGQPEHGVALLEQACGQGHAQSCTLLGYLFAKGRIVKFDTGKAMRLYVQGCDLGDSEGCFNVGDLAYSTGDPAHARTAFALACDKGNGVACARGADLVDSGVGGAADPAAATPIFKKAYDILSKQCPGDGQACWIIGFLFEHGKGLAKDMARAKTAYASGCDAESGDACRALALGLDAGSFGGKADPDAANAAFDRACTADDARSCQSYAERLGMAKKDVDHAFELAGRACELDTEYCGTLAEYYRIGLAVPADQPKATGYYRDACVAGQSTWCVRYGQRAHDGVGMTADNDDAVAASDKACDANDGEGCRQVAMYLVVRNPQAATEHAVKGCDKGDGPSCHLAASYATTAGNAGLARDYEVKGCDAETVSAAACGAAAEASSGDPAKAKGYAIKGCDADDVPDSGPACEALVKLDYFGEPKDVDEALLAATYACAFGQEDPCGWVGQLAGESKSDHTAIKDYLAKQCAVPNDGACYAQALLLITGEDADKRTAHAVMDASCKRGNARSCLLKADAYANGWGVMKNEAKAKEIYASYCDQGNANACLNVAVIANTAGDFTTAVHAAERACEQGSPGGCTEIGYFDFTAKGTQWDSAKGVEYWERACKLGEPIGCGNVGYMEQLGAGRAADAKKAFALYVKSCQPTTEFWCAGVGHYYETGEGGTTKDLKKAEDNYRLACESTTQGFAQGCSELARFLEANHKGGAAEIDHLREKALGMATEHAKDSPIHMFVLGTYYRDGVVTAKDPAKAREWFAKGCEGYDPQACVAAGQAFLETGKPEDRDRGNKYLQRACSTGYSDATKLGYESACALLKSPPKGGKPAGGGGGTTAAKGCCGASEPDAGGGLLVLAIAGLVLRRRGRDTTSRAGASRDRART